MSLDRQTIEKRDFPIGRRGYEPEAVDEHLARLADEIETLRHQPQQRAPESLAAVASQQVAAIVQAAETTAADLENQASAEAARIRRDADLDAQTTRNEAIETSQAHVGRVSDSVAHMLQRVDAMEAELGALVESLRTGTNRLQADLSLLQGNMGELHDAGRRSAPGPVEPAPLAAAPEPVVEFHGEAAPADDPDPVVFIEPEPEPDLEVVPEPEPEVSAESEPATEVAAPAAPAPIAAADEDVEGARLIALNMALNGTDRNETDRYLADNFDLSDRQGLLDEVYASVEG